MGDDSLEIIPKKLDRFIPPFNPVYLKNYNPETKLGAQRYTRASWRGGKIVGTHNARDISLPLDNLIFAPCSGEVINASSGSKENGASVTIKFHIYNQKTREFEIGKVTISHLKDIKIKKGDNVKAGDDLGTAFYIPRVRQTMVCIKAVVAGKYTDFIKLIGKNVFPITKNTKELKKRIGKTINAGDKCSEHISVLNPFRKLLADTSIKEQKI